MSAETLSIVNNKLTVKAVTYKNRYTPLAVKEVEIPVTPGSIVKPNEILVQVKATSFNPIDCCLKSMNKGWFTRGDRIIGCDFAGVVVKAGSKTKFSVGDKVYGDVLNIMSRGSFSEYILIDPSAVLFCDLIPEGISFEEAGSLPMVSATAYQCLDYYSGDLKGKNVLVLGAGTSVGSYALQFAKYHFKAATVVGTCSPRSNERVLESGADLTVDYSKGDRAKINDLLEFVKTNGMFDIIIDVVRDESVMDYFQPLLKPASENGIFVQVDGSYTIDYRDVSPIDFFPSFKKLSYSLKYSLGLSKYKIVTEVVHQCEPYAAAMEQLHRERGLYYCINSVRDVYTDVQDVYDLVATAKVSGKVVLKW